jgi:cytochrome c oxidase assembly protein subunit 15
MLTTILAVWLWRKEERRWVKTLGWVALAAVIVQGVLGGLTVLLLLPTSVSVSHATLAQSFFALMVVIALVTSPGWISHQPTESSTIHRTRQLALFASGAVFLQLVLGAWMRHSQAGLAIPDFPLSYGGILPPHGAAGLAAINDVRSQLELPPVTMEQVWIHFAHRIGALIATAAVITCGVHILRTYRDERRLREPAIIQLMLVIVQVLLGALTVWSGKGVQVTTAHVATGALLLATCVFLTVRSYHLYAAPAVVEAGSVVPEGARS